MPDVQLTDDLGKPVEDAKVDLTNTSSLNRYLKSEVLHLAVFPDFLKRKNEPLSEVAAEPIQFQAKAEHAFQLGGKSPEITIEPELGATLRANASTGSSLFDSDPFHAVAKVPANTGYVCIGFEGSLDSTATASDGDLRFGIEGNSGVKFEYLKAFPLDGGQPTLGAAVGQAISSFTIPADLPDLSALGLNDIATVTGSGRLKISGGVRVSLIPNPLASAALPLGLGPVSVKAGPAVGVSTSFAVSGSYEIRVRRKGTDSFEFSISPEHGTTWNADLTASAGVAVTWGETDLISLLLTAISPDPTKDKQALADLSEPESTALKDAVKNGLDHSLQACLETVLTSSTSDHPAFQYEIQLSRLSPEGSTAVRAALRGDLSLLTGMEASMESGGVLAPGLTMMNSVFAETSKTSITVKVNLLGILNYSTLSDLVRKSEVVTDDVTGDVTIKETVTGNRISAMVNSLDRAEALRKAMFDSVLTTTSYRAAKAITMPDLSCEQVHFALNQNTKPQTVTDYSHWFAALNLLTPEDQRAFLDNFVGGGQSTCVLRTAFSDSDCEAMFFDASGNPHEREYYLEIGRRAMRALLDPQHNPEDQLRYRIVDNALWPQAIALGANPNLGPLVGLETDDPHVQALMGDVDVIASWAKAMAETGAVIEDVRNFVCKSEIKTLMTDSRFQSKRDALQRKLASIVKASKTRFDEPWGMVCLFWAAGSPHTAYGKASSKRYTFARGTQRTFTAVTAAPTAG